MIFWQIYRKVFLKKIINCHPFHNITNNVRKIDLSITSRISDDSDCEILVNNDISFVKNIYLKR